MPKYYMTTHLKWMQYLCVVCRDLAPFRLVLRYGWIIIKFRIFATLECLHSYILLKKMIQV